MPPIIERDKCSKCGQCADICPSDVFFGSEKNKIPVITYSEECWHCNACVSSCPQKAIKLRIPLPLMVLYQKKG